jgi:hypothetical protein
MLAGSSCSWAYGGWIYNYPCNYCLSPLKSRVWILLLVMCIRYNIMWYSVYDLWQVGGFLRYSGFLHQDIWPPHYYWNIVERGVKHHNPKPNPNFGNPVEGPWFYCSQNIFNFPIIFLWVYRMEDIPETR